jgi:hypothetical protein
MIGNVLQRGDLVAAVRAARARRGEVEAFAGGRLLATQLGRLGVPVALHHPRQAMDHDVEEAADEEAEQAGEEGEGERVGRTAIIGGFRRPNRA